MPLVLITLGLLAQNAADSGNLHTFGVIDVVVGVVGLVFWCFVALAKAVD